MEVYDFETNEWKTLPDLPSKRVFPMYVATDTNIFSIGGLISKEEGFSGACEVFDIEKG
jgi:N-acetylneuraminic acid mutarotase